MAYMIAPSGQAPTVALPVRTDEEIVPHIRWVPIGKSNCSLDLDKKQSNPIFKMAVDLLMHTNFHMAFTASSTILSIYIQLHTANIREVSYYQKYQANVAKHRRFLAGKTGSAQDSPAPKPAKPARKPKPTTQKARINILQYLIHLRMWSVTSSGTVISFTDAFSASSSDKTWNLILRLKTRRIFGNLESFIGGRLREGDYKLLKRTE
nr:hypothetical protein [Tanacetum cinerariifolium]